MTPEEMGMYTWVPVVFLALGFALGWLITGLLERRKLVKLGTHAQDLDAKLTQAKADLGAATA